MIPDYPGCSSCPLKDCPPVPGVGDATVDGLMIIGEAPGVQEVAQKRPFVGMSGQLLEKVLSALGISRGDVYMTNACLCRPEGNETPPRDAIVACHDRLVQEIRCASPEKILTVGAVSLSSLVNGGEKSLSITSHRGLGRMVRIDDREIYTVGTYHPAYILRDPDSYRDFAQDLTKWVSNNQPQPRIVPGISIPQSREDVLRLLDLLRLFPVVGCDLETTGFDFLQDQILSIGFGVLVEGFGFSIIVPKEVADSARPEIIEFIRSFEGVLAFHNIKFDMQFLMVWGGHDYDLWPRVPVDTMLMQLAQDERGSTGQKAGGRGYRTLGLKEQARLRFDIEDYHFNFKAFFKLPEGERPYLDLYKYQALDTILTPRLFDDLLKELLDESPRLWTHLCLKILFPGARALARMEYNGFPIDLEYFQDLSTRLHLELEHLVDRLCTTARAWGVDQFKPGYAVGVRRLWEKMGFSPPPNAEREVIQLMLKDPRYPLDVVEFVNGILEFRQKSKLLSTYVDGVLSRVGDDGRVRADFLLTGADTGRLGSRDPNLQNIPTLVGPIIRRGYIAPPGWTLAEIDYSQLELRVIAFYSRDEELMNAYREDRDVHRVVAAKMFKKPEAEVTHLERYMAKYVDFGIIYGRSASSLANGWEMEYVVEQGGTPWTESEAQQFLTEFLDGMPGLRDYIKSQHRQIVTTRYTETPLGRRRRFPYISSRTIGDVQRRSVNTPTQSLASDICLYNLTALSESLPRDEAQVISIVHDAIYVLIRSDRLDIWLPFCISTMETNLPIPFDIPLKVEAKIGQRWGELDKV